MRRQLRLLLARLLSSTTTTSSSSTTTTRRTTKRIAKRIKMSQPHSITPTPAATATPTPITILAGSSGGGGGVVSVVPPPADIPIGIWLIRRLGRSRWCGSQLRVNRQFAYKASVLVLTYLAYTCFHMTRKPIAVVKSVLHRNCTNLAMPNEYLQHLRDTLPAAVLEEETWCDYPPFDGQDSAALLGYLDSAFLFTYAIAMFGSGLVAERVSLRYFLSLGMLFSGIFCYLFGAGKLWDIHNIWYFVAVQALAGLCQTTGWPGVVTVVGRWFGKSKHGFIFGVWNSHTSIGNILGTMLAARYLETDWALSFIVPGSIMGAVGFLLFLFLVDSPEHVGCQQEQTQSEQLAQPQQPQMLPDEVVVVNGNGDTMATTTTTTSATVKATCTGTIVYGGPTPASGGSEDGDDTDVGSGDQVNPSARTLNGNIQTTDVGYRPTERTPMLSNALHGQQQHQQQRRASVTSGSSSSAAAVGFTGALLIPGVIEFSLCLFFSKLVSYTFLYWLPLYIQSSTSFGATASAKLSVLFDVGGIFGGIIAGTVSDYTGMSACTCSGMLLIAVPILLMYQAYGALSYAHNVVLLFIAGLFVNGPYALITTSVSASLGQHSSLEGNSKALATVTAIIDGTGSIGAALGPLIAGLVSSHGWNNVFRMLMLSDFLALLLLSRLVTQEFSKRRRVAVARIE